MDLVNNIYNLYILDPFGYGFENVNTNGTGFKEFWEDLDDFFGASQGKGRPEKSKKGRDVIVSIEISFMEAIHGCQKEVQFERVSVCSACNGSKCKPGTSATNCSTCGGSGRVLYKQGFMSVQMECSSCNGEGKSIRNPCLKCYGKGQTNTTVKETINIPKGVDDNMNLRMQKKVSEYFKKKLNRDITHQTHNMVIYTSK